MKNKLSHIADNIGGQPMFQMLAKVQELERSGKEILHFELGEPDFDTPSNITDAACQSLRAGNTHYVNSGGISEFKEVVQEATFRTRKFKPDLDQILITPGANSIIYFAIKCIVNAGEEVIVPNPGFPTYFSAIKACGAKVVNVALDEANNFRLDPSDLEKAITVKTKLIIINSPSNPTGAMMTPEEIEEVYKIAAKHNIFLLSDEIYARLVFSSEYKFSSPAIFDQCRERTIIVNGFSKAFAMTGWRLGVAIGPNFLIKKMALLLETIVSCVPPFIQVAGIEAIKGKQDSVVAMKEEYAKRAEILVDGLNSIDGIRCVKPSGAIYAFANITGTGMTSEEFAEFALHEAGVALLPGTNFGEYGEGFVRMCYVNSVDKIERAVANMKAALAK
jgi:aspartate/methionine/tyrosine aminotransferase